jgi:serine/threonine protein kinase
MADLFKKITNAEYQFPKHFSKNLKDLLAKILVPSPNHRITFDQMLESPWIKELPSDEYKQLSYEISTYAKRNSTFEDKKCNEANFVDLISFFSSKILIRVLERSTLNEIETFTSEIKAEVLVTKLKDILKNNYQPNDLSMSFDGPNITVL